MVSKKTKQNIVYTEIRQNALYDCQYDCWCWWMSIVPVRMRPETTGQCGEVLAGHLINEATQGENTLAAINCSLLITCMCQGV